MSGKISLIVFGLIVIVAVLVSAENSEDSSLSEDLAASRVVREADAGRRKRKQRNNKKSKKGKGKKPRRNGRKSKKSKKNKGKRPGNVRQTGRSVDGACVESAVTVMKRWRTVVANFDKQMTRVMKQAEIAVKKTDKKAAFAPIALKLVDLGGGNKSALTCSGSADSDGAKQLTNLTQTLFDCEKMVNSSCTTDFPKPNSTFIDECNATVTAFKTKAAECEAKAKEATAADACTCFSSEEMKNASAAVTSCKLNTTGVSSGLKACKEAFSKCRKFEDDAISSMAACSVSVDKLKEKAAALYKSKAAMDDAKAKVKKTTGSSKAPRRVRAAATTCAEFITLVEKITKLALDFPASPMIATVGADIVASADPTCSDAEKASLVTAEAGLEEAAAAVEDAYNEAQATLEDATGSTASVTELTATTKAARNRVRSFQRQLFA